MGRFDSFYAAPYALLEKAIKKHIKNKWIILDMGCGDGVIEELISKHHQGCVIHCVDFSAEELAKLKEYPETEIVKHHSDIHEFLKTNQIKFNAIVVNTVLHEINTPSDQSNYMRTFYDLCHQNMLEGGKLIIGDHYFPPEVPDDLVKEFRKFQLASIGHADLREKFVNPEIILTQVRGFRFMHQKEIVSGKGIDRRYYVFVLERE